MITRDQRNITKTHTLQLNLRQLQEFLITNKLTTESYYRLFHIVVIKNPDIPGSTLCKYLQISQSQFSIVKKTTLALLGYSSPNDSIVVQTLDKLAIKITLCR